MVPRRSVLLKRLRRVANTGTTARPDLNNARNVLFLVIID